MTARIERAAGWIRPEYRGRVPHAGVRTASSSSFEGLRPRVMLSGLPPMWDQHSVGYCTAEALAAGIEFLGPRTGYPAERPDRPALYGRMRALIGTSGEDSGAILADGVEVLRRGWERELEEPPPEWGERWTRIPPLRPADAPRLVNAEPLDYDPPTIATELDAGHVVVCGLSITAQWHRAWGQAALAPPSGDVVGGHAVALVGYDLAAQCWVVRNSWGPQWGEGGYALLPWAWTALPWCGELHVLRAIRHAGHLRDDGPTGGGDLGGAKQEFLDHFVRPVRPASWLADLGIEHDLQLPPAEKRSR